MALSPSITEGFIKFNVAALPGKPCQTYYKIIGTLGEGATPLIALHGGPGVNHEYLLVLADLGIPLVVYDQIGTGKSTHYPEKMGDISFWTDQLFLDELETVIHHLGLQGDYNLAGHSWGGMLAARHAVLQPKGLKRLILMSTPADMKLWIKSQSNLRKQLPQTIQDILTVHEESKTTDSKEYQEAMGEFYGHFLCTIKPMPEPIVHGFGEIAKDPTVYLTMNGPSEFHITGPLADWTIVQDAHKINVPTLVTNGELDEAQDEVVAPFFKEISRVKWVKFAKSSHMAHFEERERFMKEVSSFLAY